MEIKVAGVDIAKRYFQVHGVDTDGIVVLRRKITRDRFLRLFEDMPSCVIGMEAGSPNSTAG